MPHHMVCNYMPDDFDPSFVTEAMMAEIRALNREMIAAGVRKFACGIAPVATRRRCGPSTTARCSSPMGRRPKPTSKWRDFGSGTVFTRGRSTPRTKTRPRGLQQASAKLHR